MVLLKPSRITGRCSEASLHRKAPALRAAFAQTKSGDACDKGLMYWRLSSILRRYPGYLVCGCDAEMPPSESDGNLSKHNLCMFSEYAYMHIYACRTCVCGQPSICHMLSCCASVMQAYIEQVYIYIYTSICTYIHIHTYIHTYMHACMDACTHAYIHTYIHTYINTRYKYSI